MRILATLAASLLVTSAYAQQTGIFQSYIVTAQNGTINAGTSYGTSGNSNIGANVSNGAAGALSTTESGAPDLGSYNIFFNTLTLNGQVLTFKNGGGDVTAAFLNYRIYPTGAPTGSFTAINLGFTSNSTFSDVGGNSFTNAGDQLWANGVPLNLLTASGFSGIGSQQYTLEVFFSINSNLGDRFNSANGSNYFATFTVVPEPSTYAAGALLVGLVGWQVRRRKSATVTA
ncbi:MAG: PEP-CTERM sorting domain-containing protein [Verrucomicrobia bacterium]|nr:PEP-CTERM sorting domain-containing protein [Verrucomicrobiota bacterium]